MTDQENEPVQAEVETTIAVAEEPKERLNLAVDVSNVGPCKKHLKVTIPRADIDRKYDKEYTDILRNASIPGFRIGKTPRKLVERRFRKDLTTQIKATLLMESLEQIGEDLKIEPLSEPDFNVKDIELPEEGDFVYEFDVEVAPEFDLPSYKGLKIKRPSRQIGEAEVEQGLQGFLRRLGKHETKDGSAALGDYLVVDVRFMHEGKVINEVSNVRVRVEKELTFRDGRVSNFGDQMVGVKSGDFRDLKVVLAESAANEQLRGQTLEAVFVVKDVEVLNIPPVDQSLLDLLGVSDEGELRDDIRAMLGRQWSHFQLNAQREQIIDQLLKNSVYELPNDLLRRMADRTLRRHLIELRDAGYSEEEIRAKYNTLRNNSLAETDKMLRRQFVLQKIAEQEEIKIEQEDLESEVAALAMRSNESPRRVRARIEKEGLWDSLAVNVMERKTIDVILSRAEITDEKVDKPQEQTSTTGLDESAVPEPPPVAVKEEEAEK